MALAVISCAKSVDSSQGYVRLSIESDTAITEVVKSQISDYGDLPSTGDFQIEIKDSKSASVWKGKISEWDAQTPLQIGNYVAEVSYGSTSDEGFGKMAFTGSKNFSVEASKLSEVVVSAKPANTLVKIVYTTNFTNYFKDYSFVMKTGSLTEIPFVKGETRAAFIDAYKFSLTGTLTTQAGKTVQFPEKEFGNLNAATLYTVKMDVDNVGGLSISVSFNNEVENVNLEEELND